MVAYGNLQTEYLARNVFKLFETTKMLCFRRHFIHNLGIFVINKNEKCQVCLVSIIDVNHSKSDQFNHFK